MVNDIIWLLISFAYVFIVLLIAFLMGRKGIASIYIRKTVHILVSLWIFIMAYGMESFAARMTGPVIFGEPGTNGQHSFYQLLHQGTDIVPLQFIGFRKCQYGKDLVTAGSYSQTKLNANLAAQIAAFARGKADENTNKEFDGERPSSLIYGDELTPEALGALLAHFENKVMFQGFLWNLNSFDQEGVQLGKILAKKVLAGCEGDDILKAYADLLI